MNILNCLHSTRVGYAKIASIERYVMDTEKEQKYRGRGECIYTYPRFYAGYCELAERLVLSISKVLIEILKKLFPWPTSPTKSKAKSTNSVELVLGGNLSAFTASIVFYHL